MKELKREDCKKKLPTAVLMFGEGNFLRAFAAVAVQNMNDSGKFRGGLVALQGTEAGSCEKINNKNGVYTVYERGISSGKVRERAKIITVLEKCVNPYADYKAYLKYAESTSLKALISNTTEFGICYSADEKKENAIHKNYPAKLTDFLFCRYTHFKGDAKAGLVILPCELIDRNGDKLKEIVLRYTAEWELGEGFVKWLSEFCIFTNTLVDRIVSGYPQNDDNEIFEKLGYTDILLDVCEPFMLWAIESNNNINDKFPISLCGNEIIITDNLEVFRTRKVRILNGAHTLSVLAGHLCGFTFVEELVSDKYFSNLINRALYEEIIPSMQGSDLEKYAKDVLERFKNPFLKHRLLSISLNSVSKFRARVLPSVEDYISINKKAPEILSFSLAALIAFYKTETGKNARDDENILSILKEAFASADEVKYIMQNNNLWGKDLTKLEGFYEKVNGFYRQIQMSGIRDVVGGFLSE